MSNLNTRSIFPVKIYETEFPNFNSIQNNILESLLPFFEKTATDNEYFTDNGIPMIVRTESNRLHENFAFLEIANFIENEVQMYWQSLGLTKRIKPYILQMWANKIPPGGFTPAHNHNPVPIGGAFYINAVSEMGNLYLENPMEMVLGCQPRDYLEKPYLYTETIDVKPGKLIMFPGYLRHHTRSNMTNENRYVLGFNIGAWQGFKPKPTDQ